MSKQRNAIQRNFRNFFATFLFLTFCANIVYGDAAVDLFTKGINAYKARQFSQAATDLNSFAATYPQHEKRVEALYYLAESYLELKDYVNAGTIYKQVLDVGLANNFAQTASFRIGEIPWILGRYDMAKQYLLEHLRKLPQDVNNRFVLYYLGDIAMHADSPKEAEYYFTEAIRFDSELQIPAKGEVLNHCRLGLAWAKNRLGLYLDSDALYREIAQSPTNPLAEEAYCSWGIAQYERHAYAESIATLNTLLQRWPTGQKRQAAMETLAKGHIELKNYGNALEILRQTQPVTDANRLQQVRCLFALKQTTEAESLLRQVEASADSKYRDMVSALKVYQAFDQQNWTELIRIAETFLRIQYDSQAHRMSSGYFETPTYGDTVRLLPENYLKICAGLAIAYAYTGNTEKANAVYSMMSTYAKSGAPVLSEILQKTNAKLLEIAPVAPGGNSDIARLLAADQKYNSRDYLGAIAVLQPLLGAQYDEINRRMLFSYTPQVAGYGTTNSGKLDGDKMIEACQMLVLSYAYSGHAAQAAAGYVAMQSLCRADNNLHRQLLATTKAKLDQIPADSNQIALNPLNPLNPTNPLNPVNPLNPLQPTNPLNPVVQQPVVSANEMEQRRVLSHCKALYKARQYAQAETQLYALLMRNPGDELFAEALLLRGQSLLQLRRETEAITMGELLLAKFPASQYIGETLWMIGIAHVTLGDEASSLEYFERIVRQYPKNTHIDGAMYYVAMNALEDGNSRNALTQLRKIYRSHRDGAYWSHAAWELAYRAYLNEDLEEASMYVQELLNHPPDAAVADRVLYLKGQLAMDQRQWTTALVAFQELGKISPDSPLTRMARQDSALAKSSLDAESSKKR